MKWGEEEGFPDPLTLPPRSNPADCPGPKLCQNVASINPTHHLNVASINPMHHQKSGPPPRCQEEVVEEVNPEVSEVYEEEEEEVY